MPDEIPTVGPARVILGAHGGERSPIAAPPMTYLHGEPEGRRIAGATSPRPGTTWPGSAVDQGTLLACVARSRTGEVADLRATDDAIDFVAEGETRFVLGSAAKHPHDLALGSYSVHTSAEALLRGEAEIRRIGQRLLADGTLQPLT